MNKYIFGILFLLITGVATAQTKKSAVRILRSESARSMKINGVDIVKTYKATFLQDNTTLSSDSAYFYKERNAVDCFNNVVINQGDTLHVYADKLNYEGNTKTAILTDHVKLVDKDATLTTNLLTYNTGTRIGTYTGGGKLVNKDNTLISQNGYYFASSRDAYFRYNVVLTTPDAIIKTDTLRYNSGSRIAFFYGPTNICGKTDKDTLYTENGTYNTQTEQALFGKHNLYKQGTKTLKGDSLFYDRLKGYGRATKHVTFNDNEQKITIKGNLAIYTKADERTVVTQNAYVILVTEQNDTTKTDTTLKKQAALPGVGNVQLPPTGISTKNDTAVVKGALNKTAQIAARIPKNSIPTRNDTATVKATLNKAAQIALQTPHNSIPIKNDTAKVNAALNKAAQIAARIPKNSFPIRSDTALAKALAVAANTKTAVKTDSLKKAPAKTKTDSVYMSADTIETRILTFKALKALQEQQRLAAIRDTSVKVKTVASEVYTTGKPVKYLHLDPPPMPPDTSFYHRDFFAKLFPPDTTQKRKAPAPRKLTKAALKRLANNVDSIFTLKKVELSDTARVRILTAWHHAKIFKSDLQAKSDSIFYSNADSTIRMFVHPIIWAEGSQMSGDTILLQLRHKKFDNVFLFPNAFIVNIGKNDSTHFNQVAGRRIRGFFKDSKIYRVFVDGNAETIYFNRDSVTNKVTDMHRSISSRINLNFKDNTVTDITQVKQVVQTYGPLSSYKEDQRILKGFIWKPKERPVSKESIIPSEVPKVKVKKTPVKKPVVKKQGKSDMNFATGIKTDDKMLKGDSVKVKTKVDSLKKP